MHFKKLVRMILNVGTKIRGVHLKNVSSDNQGKRGEHQFAVQGSLGLVKLSDKKNVRS